MSILEVKNVSIRYITGDFKDIGLKEYVCRKLTGKYQVKEFWADRHVSFSLEKGDMLGIIGSNGAGKSTLLKAVSGIMEPTEGYVTRSGRMAALLELGSGFDGELTVKENAYLRGAMLGYTRKFMDDTYEDIIAFAELKEFEDRPFKQLSSGMKSRLAFSIASLVRPDILILDEVLSVGDGAFRQKSEAKMREIMSGGATTILVSHSLAQVRQMCNKVLWLHKGEQIVFGSDVETICDGYQAFLNDSGKTKQNCRFYLNRANIEQLGTLNEQSSPLCYDVEHIDIDNYRDYDFLEYSEKKTAKLAKLLLNGRLAVKPSLEAPEYDIDTLDFNMQVGKSPRSYQLYLQSMYPQAILCGAFLHDGDKEKLILAEKLFRKYIEYLTSDASTQNPMVSHDHVTALRVDNLIFSYGVIRSFGDIDVELEKKANSIIYDTAIFLAKDENYFRKHNHGIYQDRALFSLSYYLGCPKSMSWRKRVRANLLEQYNHAFTSEGVHVENSYRYALMVIELFESICSFAKRRNDSSLDFIGKCFTDAKNVLAYMLKPNGECPQTGDSHWGDSKIFSDAFFKSDDLLGHLLQKKLKPGEMPEHIFLPEGGYYIYHEPGMENRSDGIWAMFKSGCRSKVHKHADDLSFMLSGRGHDVFIDPGYCNYQHNDPFTQYLRSANAHNTVIVDGKSYEITTEILQGKVGLIRGEDCGRFSHIIGHNNMFNGVSIERHFYISGETIVIFDNMLSSREHVYSQLFQCAPDIAVVAQKPDEALLRMGDDDKYVRVRQILGNTSLNVIHGVDRSSEYGLLSYDWGNCETTNTLKFDAVGNNVDFITVISFHEAGDSAFDIDFDSENYVLTVPTKQGRVQIQISPSIMGRSIETISVDIEFTEGENGEFTFVNSTVIEDKAEYAWYLVDRETKTFIQKISYTDERSISFQLEKGKQYIVRGFVRQADGSKTSGTITIDA